MASAGGHPEEESGACPPGPHIDNVVLDVLLDREPHVTASALWRAIEGARIEALVPAHGFTTLFHLVTKERGPSEARRVVADLLAVFGVATVDERVLRRAMSG
jgi:hypothetical protein